MSALTLTYRSSMTTDQPLLFSSVVAGPFSGLRICTKHRALSSSSPACQARPRLLPNRSASRRFCSAVNCVPISLAFIMA